MIDTWHKIVKERDISGIHNLLADEVVMHSPVVHTPVQGKKMVTMYLHAAFHTFLKDSFHYVRTLDNGPDHVLEFEVEIDGLHVNGVDMIKFNDEGKIIDFKVMIRPSNSLTFTWVPSPTLISSPK